MINTGYTQYWYRSQEFDRAAFAKVVEDFQKVRTAVGALVPLAGVDGTGDPDLTPEMICFNGVRACGHEDRNLGIAWPADQAAGVGLTTRPGTPVGDASAQHTVLARAFGADKVATTAKVDARNATGDSDVAGTWFAGCKLQTRTCDGDCSHESFHFPRVLTDIPAWKRLEGGKYFACTKTAYKPYDLLVTAALLIADHHLKDAIRVSSDGDAAQWADTRALCQEILGYGQDFAFKEEED